MKTQNVEVTSKDTTLGTINVEEFEAVAEAVDFFQKQADAEAKESKREPKADAGNIKVLGLINSQHRANITNAERVRLTRGVSPMKALRDKVKSDPNAKAQLEALLLSLGLPSNLGS
jgi:hypothetical protein